MNIDDVSVPENPATAERWYGMRPRPRPVQPQLEVHQSERKDKVLYGPDNKTIVLRIIDRPIGFRR